MYPKRTFFMAFFVIVLFSCQIKTRLTKSELKWYNVYKENDTLIFKSENGDLDTSIIVRKELFFPDYNPLEEHGIYRPQWGIIWYKNKHLTHHPNGNTLLTLEKRRPQYTALSIDYLYSDILTRNIHGEGGKNNKKGKVYEFDTYDKRADQWQPKKIFWDEKYGIVKYITHDNVVWIRVNLLKNPSY